MALLGALRRMMGAPDLPPLEERTKATDADGMAALFVGHEPSSGFLVNATTSENLATVLACVGAISSAIASLPALVFKPDGDGRTEDVSHPLQRLIRLGPNRWQSWPDFVETLLASVLLRGNGLAELGFDGAGRITSMTPVPWSNVSVTLLPSGALAFDISAINSIFGGSGRVRRLLQDEVLFLKDRSDDGLIGRSRLSRASETISTALAAQHYGGASFRNIVSPPGSFEVDRNLSDTQMSKLRQRIDETYAGAFNARRPMILEGGLRYKPFELISPEDSELLASRRFSVEEIARIFGVPPPLAGDFTRSTFTNSETAGRWFGMHTLAPWCRKLETEFARSVFTAASASYLELDLSGLLRGAPLERWQTYDIALKHEVLTRNEVRDSEGYNARTGFDSPPAPAPSG